MSRDSNFDCGVCGESTMRAVRFVLYKDVTYHDVCWETLPEAEQQRERWRNRKG